MAFHRIVVCCIALGGCWVPMPPSIPSTARPDLPEDKPFEVDYHTEKVAVSYSKKTGHDCTDGTCTDHYSDMTKHVDVHVASATLDGRPVTLREVAVASSPGFVTDTDRVRGLTSACKRGRILMSVGGTAIVVGATLLQIGFNKENPSREKAIGGYAALGGGIAAFGGGWFVLGGQHCKEAEAIYKRWSPVYQHADETKVSGPAADMMRALTKKFNQDRKAGVANKTEPADDDTSTEESP